MIKLNKIVKKNKKQNKTKQNYMKPKWGIYLLHSLHGQFSGCHFLMCVLKELTSSNSFNVLGTKLTSSILSVLTSFVKFLRPVIDSYDVRYR